MLKVQMLDTSVIVPRYLAYLGIYTSLFYFYFYQNYYFLNTLFFTFNGMLMMDTFYYKREYLLYTVLFENADITRDFVTNTTEGHIILSFLISSVLPNGRSFFILELSDLAVKSIIQNYTFPTISIPAILSAWNEKGERIKKLQNSFLIFSFAFLVIIFNIIYCTFTVSRTGNIIFYIRQIYSIYQLTQFLYVKSVKNIYSLICEIMNSSTILSNKIKQFIKW